MYLLPQFFSILHLLNPFTSRFSFSFLFLPFSFNFFLFLFLFPPFSLPLFIFFPKWHQLICSPLLGGGGRGLYRRESTNRLYRLPQSQNNCTEILGLIGNPVTCVYCSIIVQYSDPENVFQVLWSCSEVTITCNLGSININTSTRLASYFRLSIGFSKAYCRHSC